MKKIELSIPKPCHENWAAMTPEDKGRFCASCQKTVVDFSGMSDAQLAQFFKKPTGSVCGRFDDSQLNRGLEVPRRRIPWIKYFFTIALPAFLFSLKASAQKAQSETPPKKEACDRRIMGKVAMTRPTDVPKNVAEQEPKMLGFVSAKLQAAVLKTFTGKIVDTKGEPVPYATIAAREEGRIVAADSMGNFSVKYLSLPLKLEVSSVGYLTQTTLYNGREESTIVMRPAEGEMVTVGMIVRTVRKKKTPEAPVQSKSREAAKPGTPAARFLVYPNPVSANASFTLDAKELESGIYVLELFNGSGAAVQRKELAVEKKVKQTVAVSDVSAGSYFVRLTNRKTNISHTEILLVR